MKLFQCKHADDWEMLNKRWLDVDQRVRRIELEIDDFRDKVLRKIQRRKPKEEAEDLYKGVLIPESNGP